MTVNAFYSQHMRPPGRPAGTRTHRECDNHYDASRRDFDHRTKWQEGKAGQLFELIEDARLDLLMKVAHLAACGEGGDDSERR